MGGATGACARGRGAARGAVCGEGTGAAERGEGVGGRYFVHSVRRSSKLASSVGVMTSTMDQMCSPVPS